MDVWNTTGRKWANESSCAADMQYSSRKIKTDSKRRASGSDSEAGRAVDLEGKALSHKDIVSGLET